MTTATETQTTVVRTPRGLSIAGTRITLYSILDYLKAEWPTPLIRDRLNLTEQQMDDVMAYLEAHRDAVEAEYALVLRQAEDNRQYWQERNKEYFAERTISPDKQALWEKLQANTNA